MESYSQFMILKADGKIRETKEPEGLLICRKKEVVHPDLQSERLVLCQLSNTNINSYCSITRAQKTKPEETSKE